MKFHHAFFLGAVLFSLGFLNGHQALRKQAISMAEQVLQSKTVAKLIEHAKVQRDEAAQLF